MQKLEEDKMKFLFFVEVFGYITLFRSIIIFRGTDNIMWNIPHIQSECDNIPQNIVSFK